MIAHDLTGNTHLPLELDILGRSGGTCRSRLIRGDGVSILQLLMPLWLDAPFPLDHDPLRHWSVVADVSPHEGVCTSQILPYRRLRRLTP